MAEVLHDYGLVRSTDDATYHVRACGSQMDDGRWQGWLEFEPIDGGPTLRSPRETTQPNRTDTAYWATGLSAVYIEGALHRAMNPLVRPEPGPPAVPAFDEPAPAAVSGAPPVSGSVLNPFSVYRKGEPLLRDQLHALSAWHLINIVTAYDLSDIPAAELKTMPSTELVELIVTAVSQGFTRVHTNSN